jgi:hypothetical protein
MAIRIWSSSLAVALALGLSAGSLAAQADATFGGVGAVDAVDRASVAAAPTDSAVAALNRALLDGQRAHLNRVAVWGALNLLAGAALFGASRGDEHVTRRAFGLQSAGWGAVNLGIVGWALLAGPPEPVVSLSDALAAEDRWSHILLVNLGLNVGYMAVGGALIAAADRGLRSGPSVKGHAAAVVVQGAGLMVLDGLAWAASSGRLGELRGLVEALEIGVGSAGSLASPGLAAGWAAHGMPSPATFEIGMRLPAALFGG